MGKKTHTMEQRTGEATTDYEHVQENVITGVRALVDDTHPIEELIVGTVLGMIVNTGACVDCTMTLLLEALQELDTPGMLHHCSDTKDKSKLN